MYTGRRRRNPQPVPQRQAGHVRPTSRGLRPSCALPLRRARAARVGPALLHLHAAPLHMAARISSTQLQHMLHPPHSRHARADLPGRPPTPPGCRACARLQLRPAPMRRHRRRRRCEAACAAALPRRRRRLARASSSTSGSEQRGRVQRRLQLYSCADSCAARTAVRSSAWRSAGRARHHLQPFRSGRWLTRAAMREPLQAARLHAHADAEAVELQRGE